MGRGPLSGDALVRIVPATGGGGFRLEVRMPRPGRRVRIARSRVVAIGLAVVVAAALLVATEAKSRADTTGPAVVHAPVATAMYGQPIPISMRGSCLAASGCAARLYYRSTAPAALTTVPGLVGEPGFQVAGLTRVATGAGGVEDVEWRGEIPGSAVTTTGVDYYLEADSNGSTTRYPGTPFAGGVMPIGIYFHVQVVSPPLVNHVPVAFGFAGQAFNVDTQVTCSTGNCQGTLYYRVASINGPYNSASMGQSSPATPVPGGVGSVMSFTAQVPGGSVTSRGVDYYLDVFDGSTHSFSPGTTYTGAYAPRDGTNSSLAHHVHVLETPHIGHVPVVTAPFRQPIEIATASNCPSARQCQATLYYRTTVNNFQNLSDFASTSMTVTRIAGAGVDAVTVTGTIPAGVADTRGVDYFFKITDGDTTAWWPGTSAVDTPGGVWLDGISVLYQHIRVQEPPHFTHVPPTVAPAGQDLAIETELTCATESCNVTLNYGDAAVLAGGFQSAAMTRTAVRATTSASRVETFRAVIPGSSVTTRGLAYNFTAGDGYTHTALPGTTYWGAYVPVDGGPVAPTYASGFVVRVAEPPHPFHVPVGAAFTGEPVTITATANCAASRSCPATLFWRISGQGWQSTSMTQSPRTPLAYGNDLVAYTATMAGSPTANVVLEYRVEVTDGWVTETTPTWSAVVTDRPAPTPTTVPIPTTIPPPPVTVPPATIPPVTTPPVSVPPPPATTVPPPPVTAPPVTIPPPPPITIPPPPVTVPPVTTPPTTVPPPPVTVPTVTIPPPPPITVPPPPVTVPPVTTPPPPPVTIPSPPVTVPPPPPGVLPPVVTDAIFAARAAVGCVRPSPNAELRNYDDLEEALQNLSDSAMANYSGAYIGVDQNVHVGVVGEAGRAALPASLTSDPRVTVEQAKFTVDRLDQTMGQIAGRLNSALASTPQPEGTWPWKATVSLSCNTIDVVLDPGALPKLDAAVQAISPELIEGIVRITGVQPVGFEPTVCPRDDCTPARAGLKFTRDGADWCTLGFITRDAYGRREAFTAGHCGDIGTTAWTVGGRSVGTAGTRKQSCNGQTGRAANCPYGLDYQVISLDNPNEPVPSNLAYRQETDAAPVTLRIDQPRAALEGTVVCSSGWKGFQSCGDITNYNSSGDKGVVGYGVFDTMTCHGDSGGPIFNRTNTRAYGIEQGIAKPAASEDDCNSPSYFTWTGYAQQDSGRKVLLTTTTEALGPNQRLQPGSRTSELRSRDGRFHLNMQTDGNLTLNQEGNPTALWSLLNYAGQVVYPGSYAVMQDDGNLVVRKANGTAVWDWHSHKTGTATVAGAWASIQDDGNFVVRTVGAAQWDSGTCCH
ncbi:MAG: hypothetical protein QOF60_1941 [Actinomycetota bacterium]|nr:hypothetical protein [Actinomycetota bacterium]